MSPVRWKEMLNCACPRIRRGPTGLGNGRKVRGRKGNVSVTGVTQRFLDLVGRRTHTNYGRYTDKEEL